MGVRFLNRLIQSKCQASVSTSGTAAAIERIHFEQLRGKKVAVDISIYIYRFLAEGALLENMYLLASIFRYYDINAIFVFDGPPPAQKTDVIEARKKKKDDAKRQFQVLETTLKTKKMEPRVDTHEIAEIEESMTQLKKQFIHIRDNDIINVKDLLISFGFTIVDAEGEADALCAKLTIKRRVFACMSDDTDMFVYGCPFILRHVSLLNHSAVCYNMSEILSNMKLTQDEFKMICIANGTDYNSPAPPMPIPPSVVVGVSATDTKKSSDSGLRIFKMYEYMQEFKRLGEKERRKYESGFYEWLEIKKKNAASVISLIEYESMFDTSKSGSSDHYKQLVVLNRKDINKRRIVEIMMKEDFIFIDSNTDDRTILSALSSGSGSITSSPVYGVGQWESANTSSASSASSASASASACAIASRRITKDAGATVKIIEEGAIDTENDVISQECKASILASEVYGVDASSIQELNTKIKRSNPIKIKK
jgi:5'-3' exonuclease